MLVIEGRVRPGSKLSPKQAGELQTNAVRDCGHQKNESPRGAPSARTIMDIKVP